MQNLPKIDFLKDLEKLGFEILSFEEFFKNIDLNTHFMTKPHKINFYNILYFNKTQDKHFVDFVEYKIKNNQLIFISKEQVHAFSKNIKHKGFIILFTEEFLKRNFITKEKSIFNICLKPIILEDLNSEFETIFKQLYSEYKKEKSLYKEKILAILLNYLILKYENSLQDKTINQKHKLIFEEFKELIYKNYFENKNVSFYAKYLKISSKHLNTITKEFVKLTAKQLIDSYLILEAKRQLACTNKPIKEIAFNLGFYETTNFIKYFKKHTNISPSKFKQNFTI
ncbi:hypothetical protein CP985_12790 [Malaciobacter mytili LMG 24559]|uniref:HTH araC/xylS-type domain-containing protein n=1 Tax=Malaciobacter mytili LMG 24559 TaxID=1032238 RepID=A0AAX2AGP6_9BACT|nr:helix-turn-helix domain-containing protein [Malaciobacter mytili]AXH13634.1 transcriptional regulator, AraC family [Malaciobacter mytili LMG 24559]RXK13818.1 hypothetical protein CP985_12790 [Malaciobacter mytili LMG 24559]